MKLEKKPKTLLHLRLTTEDWVESFKELSRAELGVLYYIRTKDPYGDRNLEIDCTELGKLLGIHRTSISRALEELKNKGFIDMEIEKAKVRQKINNRRLTLLTSQENKSKDEQIEDLEICAPTHSLCVDAQLCAPTHSNEHSCTTVCVDAQLCAPTQKNESKPLPNKDSSVTQTIQTYSDFIKTLSRSEKENFLEFGNKKAAQLPRPPELPLKWIEANFEELREQWEKSRGRKDTVQAQKWENHPQREEWLEKIRQLGPVGFQAEDMPNQKLRREF